MTETATATPFRALIWARAEDATARHRAKVKVYEPHRPHGGPYVIVVRDLTEEPGFRVVWQWSGEMVSASDLEGLRAEAEYHAELYRHRLIVDWYRIRLAQQARNAGANVRPMPGVVL